MTTNSTQGPSEQAVEAAFWRAREAGELPTPRHGALKLFTAGYRAAYAALYAGYAVDGVSGASPDEGAVVERCRHGEPEGGCSSCAACAACQGECGVCPCVPSPDAVHAAEVERREGWLVAHAQAVEVERDDLAAKLADVTCMVCDEVILPEVDATPDGERWAHRDCMEAGE